jgi:type I restriction enzyme S subunit
MEQIVDLIEESLTSASAASQAVAADVKRADRLRQSVLRDAFEGKLVEQDPGDEPAAVLLERIRAKRDHRTAGSGLKRRNSTGQKKFARAGRGR